MVSLGWNCYNAMTFFYSIFLSVFSSIKQSKIIMTDQEYIKTDCLITGIYLYPVICIQWKSKIFQAKERWFCMKLNGVEFSL